MKQGYYLDLEVIELNLDSFFGFSKKWVTEVLWTGFFLNWSRRGDEQTTSFSEIRIDIMQLRIATFTFEKYDREKFNLRHYTDIKIK